MANVRIGAIIMGMFIGIIFTSFIFFSVKQIYIFFDEIVAETKDMQVKYQRRLEVVEEIKKSCSLVHKNINRWNVGYVYHCEDGITYEFEEHHNEK